MAAHEYNKISPRWNLSVPLATGRQTPPDATCSDNEFGAVGYTRRLITANPHITFCVLFSLFLLSTTCNTHANSSASITRDRNCKRSWANFVPTNLNTFSIKTLCPCLLSYIRVLPPSSHRFILPPDNTSHHRLYRHHRLGILISSVPDRSTVPSCSGVPRNSEVLTKGTPKFRSFDKVEPHCKLSGKCLVFLFQHPN